jgi:3-oxoadipate enol-lactonase
MTLHHLFEGRGDAPVLVLSHSIGTSLELWDANVPDLAKEARVLRYDHRGHGRSPVPPGPYAVEDLAADLLDLFDELDLERVSLCGLSLGGAVGLYLGATAPERLDRLVVACSSLTFDPPERWQERAELVRADGMAAVSHTAVQRWFTERTQQNEPELVERFRLRLETTSPEGYAASCEALMRWDFHDRVGEVRVPTLVIAGAGDMATPPDEVELIADGVPDGQFELVEEAAHFVNVEQPREFSRLVLDHLRAGETVAS